jgi:hypothetical protein
MNEKYIDERLGFAFVFGQYADGRVDLHREGLGCTADIATHISEENAESLLADRSKLMETIYALAKGWDAVDPEGFKKYWYGK